MKRDTLIRVSLFCIHPLWVRFFKQKFLLHLLYNRIPIATGQTIFPGMRRGRGRVSIEKKTWVVVDSKCDYISGGRSDIDRFNVPAWAMVP